MILIFIYIIAAVLPAAILMIYAYQQDKVEKEPPGMLAMLCFLGAVAVVPSAILEELIDPYLGNFVSEFSPFYTAFVAFVGVAVIEEGFKFLFLRLYSWNKPAFNYKFDAILYAVFVSLGFAALENIGYVFGYGLTTAGVRAFTSIPGHMSFAVFMGIFYGTAKMYSNRGQHARSVVYQILSYATAVLMHGIYDTCAMYQTTLATILLLVFLVFMYVVVFEVLRKEAKADVPIDGGTPPMDGSIY